MSKEVRMLNDVERDFDQQLDAMLLAGEARDAEVADGNVVGDPEDAADDDADDDEFEDADGEDEDEDDAEADSGDALKE